MAVVYEKEHAPRVEIDPNVEPFLATRPLLKEQLADVIARSRRLFPIEPLRVYVERDPDDYEWETLVFAFESPSDDALDRVVQFMDEDLAALMRSFPTEIVATTA